MEHTKYKPIEIRDLEEPIVIDEVLKNILKSFKRHIINKNEIIDNNKKLLLLNNIIKTHDYYIKNNKDKKGSYAIPCIFKTYINSDTIQVYFDKDISEEYKKGIEISVSINTCIIVPEFVYNYYLTKHKKIQDDDNNDANEINNEKENCLMDYMQYIDNNDNISIYEDKNNSVQNDFDSQKSNDEKTSSFEIKEKKIKSKLKKKKKK